MPDFLCLTKNCFVATFIKSSNSRVLSLAIIFFSQKVLWWIFLAYCQKKIFWLLPAQSFWVLKLIIYVCIISSPCYIMLQNTLDSWWTSMFHNYVIVKMESGGLKQAGNEWCTITDFCQLKYKLHCLEIHGNECVFNQ